MHHATTRWQSLTIPTTIYLARIEYPIILELEEPDSRRKAQLMFINFDVDGI